MKAQNILFICSGAIDRSPCASSLVEGSKFAGISPLTEYPVTVELVDWAELIVCMEYLHKSELFEQIPRARMKEVVVLDVPNNYLRYDPELERILRNKIKLYLIKK